MKLMASDLFGLFFIGSLLGGLLGGLADDEIKNAKATGHFEDALAATSMSLIAKTV